MNTLLGSLNWPSACLIFALIALFALKKPLRDMLKRTKSISNRGLELGEPQAGQTSKEPSGLEEFMRSYDNALLQDIEASIREDLAKRKIAASDDRERALIRGLAAKTAILSFEQVYQLIWRSQIECLRFLNSRPLGATEEQIRNYYELGKTNYPDMYEGYLFDGWVGYLQSHLLMRQDGSLWNITVFGREFLKYLIDLAKSEKYYG